VHGAACGVHALVAGITGDNRHAAVGSARRKGGKNGNVAKWHQGDG
jgi:hypothetical protein